MEIPVKNRLSGDTFDALERDIKAARAFASNINAALRSVPEIDVELTVTTRSYEIFLRKRILDN